MTARRPVSLTAVLGILAVAVATLVLRIPHFFEPPWHDDAGIYAAIGHGILNGQLLYVDVLDNRPPGLYLIYAAILALSDYYIPSIAMAATLFFLATQATLFYIARELSGTRLALATALLWGALGTAPTFDGDIPNAEVFMALPAALGMLLVLRRQHFAAGVAFGCALLVKQIAGADVAAAVVAVALFAPRPWSAIRGVALGAAIPIGAAGIWLLAQGVADEFLYAGVGYYFNYYVQRETRVPGEFWILKLALLCIATAAIWWHQRGTRSFDRVTTVLPFFWLAFALYGTLFTSRAYPHYVQQTLLPLSLVAMLLCSRIRLRLPSVPQVARALPGISAAVAGAWLFSAVYFPWAPWARWERNPAYYQNFIGYISGQRDVSAYNDFFDRRVNRNLALTRYLKSRSNPTDYIMVWGEEPWLYVLSELRVGLRYTVGYFAWEMPDGLKEVVRDLQAEKPRFFVWTQTHALFPELKAELERNYELALVMDKVVVLERRKTAGM